MGGPCHIRLLGELLLMRPKLPLLSHHRYQVGSSSPTWGVGRVDCEPIWARCVPEAALTHPPGLPFWSASHLRVERRSPRELDGNPGVSRPPLHRGPAGRAAGFSRGLPVPTPLRHWALCPPGPQRLRPGHRPLGPLGSYLGQVTAQKSYFLSQQRAPYSFRSQGRDEAVMSI